MRRHITQVAALAVALIPTFATADEGFSRNEIDLKRTVLGAFLARNAGTGAFSRPVSAGAFHSNNGVLNRLLALEEQGRAGPPDKIVNEAVALQLGYTCPNYDQLPVAMRGCKQGEIPTHHWNDAHEVREAAQKIGFSCGEPVNETLDCAYQAKLSQHTVRFNILPSVDGHRLGLDSVYEVNAKMHFDPATGPTMTVNETQS